MNELELFENAVDTGSTMTTKELADSLGISVDSVQNAARKLFRKESVKYISTGGRPTMSFNQAQATAIKLELQNHSKVNYLSPKTALERQLIIKQAMQIQQEIIDELKAENETMKPKAIAYDEFVAREKFCNFTDAANYLHIKRNELIELLKTKYIYKNSVGEYRAYSEYARYFALRPFEKGRRVGQQLMFTIEGLEYFREKVGA